MNYTTKYRKQGNKNTEHMIEINSGKVIIRCKIEHWLSPVYIVNVPIYSVHIFPIGNWVWGKVNSLTQELGHCFSLRELKLSKYSFHVWGGSKNACIVARSFWSTSYVTDMTQLSFSSPQQHFLWPVGIQPLKASPFPSYCNMCC